ncbi:MAG: hypothetical protein C0481_02700 [Phenylobacterium sp.]|uniref:sialate O-acetylesterase n=1 Tax=Phenylobacterium sp. TaxID=1871053 RepID=UPI0025F97853|nr:sialate O-acetylesterase [Phenylobacterium sp.]MBA4010753.1 hypothetical protein [Phenylobacterium sp.]
MIKHARGETGLAADPAARVQAVLWMQGETDADSPAKSEAYAANLAGFVAQVRARWGDIDTTVQIGQIDRPCPAG